jgi:tetratricopeptide (TPR) repeat protein
MGAGTMIGDRFEILRLASSGGMGEVYEAQDQKTGQRAAIKIVNAMVAGRFGREVDILAALEHPQIVRYLAHGTLPSGALYLAMEWLPGEDLSSRVARGPLAVAETITLAQLVAGALGFAHARGVVHRDLKPSNLFLVGGVVEGVKILDFGVAHLLAAPRMTQTGTIVGTPRYMAPEQARGDAGLDARADVFSLGCVLYECVTGEAAFDGPHPMAVLTRILFEEPLSMRAKQPGVSQALEALIARMLAKRAVDRPRDGREVAEVLRALADGSPAAAGEMTMSRVPTTLTGNEQRAVAVLLLGAPTHLVAAPARALYEMMDAAETVEMDDHGALDYQVKRYGGQLEHLRNGSAAVVLTGPDMATDLAARAARCALSLRALAEGRPIALALSHATTGERSPMGPAIDRAARLLRRDIANDGTAIVCDEVVVGLLDGRFDVRETPLGFALHREVEPWEGMRTLLGKATPCVGRERELGALEQLVDECAEEGEVRIVLVTAPAGAGKSRLAQEFLRHVKERKEPIAIWMCRGDPLSAGSAFSMLGQPLRRASGIQEGEPLEVRRQKLLGRVAERVASGAQRRVAEFLGEFIGAPFPDEDSLSLRAARSDAQLMTEQMRAAFIEFLGAELAVSPVVIVLEDLQWGDRPTVQFLDRALRDLRYRPLFVLALARPEVHKIFPDLWKDRHLEVLGLRALPRKAIERLVRHVLGESVDQETLDRLARLSEGNAFYLEELIRCTAQRPRAELPETVLAMVQSRLATLDDDSRLLVRAASVFGEVFWAGGLMALLGSTSRAPRMTERLAELIDREVLVKRVDSRFPGEEEVAFRHALLREGAYGMLTDEDRALGHQLAGDWLEQRGEQNMLVLAEHFEKGGDGERAGSYYLRAAEQALAGGDAMSTMTHVRRGLAGDLPAALRVRLLGTLCEAIVWHPELLTAVTPSAEELSRAAERGSRPWVQAMCAKLNGAMHAGKLDQFLETLGALGEIEPIEATAGPLSFGLATGMYLLDLHGQISVTNTYTERLAMVAHTTQDREPLASILWHIVCGGRAGYALKDPFGGFEHSNAAVSLAGSVGHSRYIGIGQLFLSMNLWLLGGHAEAERRLRQITLPDEEASYLSPIRPFCLAWLLAERGAFDEARAWARHLAMSGRARRLPSEQGLGHWVLAEVQRRAGELAAAEDEIHAALGCVSPRDHAGALATLAAIHLARGRHDEALVVAKEAISRAESAGACSLFFRDAFLRLTYAECLDAVRDRVAARTAILAARQWILDIAEKIGDAALRESFLHQVPENRTLFDLALRWAPDEAQGGS